MNKQIKIKYRIGKSKVFQLLITLIAFSVTIPLVFIIFYILREGITKINWSFISNLPKPVGEDGGGILNALVGSVMIVFFAAIIAVPIGIFSGIYLSENKTGIFSYWCRLAVDVLQGVPSIVIGIVAYFWVVKPLGTFSALSGSLALALMMLPIIVRSTEETLKMIPSSLKEAGLALGLPYHKVIMKIILPCGMSGILTSVMLAVARVVGETAPLLFTAFGNPYLTFNMKSPMQSLPLLIFNYSTSPYDEWHNIAWGAATILLLTVLLLNIITKIISNRWKVQL
jgi:phosphate transport system permease protein